MDNMQMEQWIGQPGQTIIARINRWDQKVDCNGSRFWNCSFVTAQGPCQGRIWPDDQSTRVPNELRTDTWYVVVSAPGQRKTESCNRLAMILSLPEALSSFDTPGFASGGRYEDWIGFLAWFEEIANPALQSFVLQVFFDKGVRDSFFSLPASRRHHHSWPGGLVEHSLEVAQLVSSHRLIHNSFERWVCSVAGLFHDLGKVRTLNANASQRRHSELLDHESLTLEMLARPLAWLDRVDPDAAHLLRYALIWGSERASRPLEPAVMAIREADRMSAAVSAKAIAFANTANNRRFATLDGPGPKTRFWRPSSDYLVLQGPS